MTPLRNIISTIPKILSTTVTTTSHHFRRHITTIPSSDTSSWLASGLKEDEREWEPNGSMKSGPKYFLSLWNDDKGVFGWVLMPGVPKKNVKVNVLGSKIVLEGVEHKFVNDFPCDEILRGYKANMCIDPLKFDASKVKVEIFNGILWVHVPILPLYIPDPLPTTVNRLYRRHLTTETIPTTKPNAVYNGTLYKGYELPFMCVPTKDAFTLRVDWPGIHNSDLKFNILGSRIYLSGQEPKNAKIHPFGSGHCVPRFYEVEVEYDPLVYLVEWAKVEVRHGVLWVRVPKIVFDGPDGLAVMIIGSVTVKVKGPQNFEIRDTNTGQLISQTGSID